MWDLIVSVPDHCLSFYFAKEPLLAFLKAILVRVYAPSLAYPSVVLQQTMYCVICQDTLWAFRHIK